MARIGNSFCSSAPKKGCADAAIPEKACAPPCSMRRRGIARRQLSGCQRTICLSLTTVRLAASAGKFAVENVSVKSPNPFLRRSRTKLLLFETELIFQFKDTPLERGDYFCRQRLQTSPKDRKQMAISAQPDVGRFRQVETADIHQ